MSDVQLLFIVLAVLYGWECACWIRRGGLAFVTWIGRKWHEAQPGALAGNQRGGFVFAPPLPPLGTILTARPLPLSVSPDGVLAYVSTHVNQGWRPGQSGKFLAFESIKEVRTNGKKLLVNGDLWLSFPGTESAREVTENLSRLLKIKPAQREKEIAKWMAASFDRREIEKRWEELKTQSRDLRLAANALFVHLFVITPILISQLGLKSTWLGLLLALLTLTVTASVLFRRGHKVLYPRADDERFTHTLTIALSAPTSIRAMDTLSRPLFESFHPLAVAGVFLRTAAFRAFARRVLLDIRHPALPLCPSDQPAVIATELHARTVLRRTAEEFLKRNGIDADELCQPPKPEESCRAYCPRCEAQFVDLDARCTDCGGMSVVAFPATGKVSAS
jgi:hypothetical protein